MTGPRPTHPFKVIESEPDRRSISSDSRSVHGRQVSVSRLVSNESTQQRGPARPSEVTQTTFISLFSDWQKLKNFIKAFVGLNFFLKFEQTENELTSSKMLSKSFLAFSLRRWINFAENVVLQVFTLAAVTSSGHCIKLEKRSGIKIIKLFRLAEFSG